MFDFESIDTEILINPRMDLENAKAARAQLPTTGEFSSHYWIATSGTTATSSSEKKWVALSKQAILTSAKAVNTHLGSGSDDYWLHTLPDFHVGGLGIWARAHLSRASVCKLNEWSPSEFLIISKEKGITLSALVPTQVYDIVVHELKAPPSIRAVIVGGGALATSLYEKALSLGWPLLPSYGLSECASQVATALPGSKDLSVLSHVEVTTNQQGMLCLKSPSLLTAYAKLTSSQIQITNPKQQGIFITEDRGEVNEGILKVYGRDKSFIKIGGESVSLTQLEFLLDELKLKHGIIGDISLVPQKDDRLGKVIHLWAVDDAVDGIINDFNDRVMPYERIRSVRQVERIPRTALGKLQLKLSRRFKPKNLWD